jgi:hypothetical protein
MKKFSFTLVMAIAASLAFAQTAPKFGVKAGANLANLNWTVGGNASSNNRIGFHGGLLAHIHLSRQWALQPEALYSAEGATIKNLPTGSYTYKNDYINIPLMLQYMFDNGFRIEAGPQLGLLIKSTDKDVFRSTNVGVGFGLNYLSSSGLGLGGRYNLGLTNVTEAAYQNAKSRVIQLGLFYMFDNTHKRKSR